MKADAIIPAFPARWLMAVVLVVLMLPAVAVRAESYDRIPADPVQDAKDNYAAQTYEFSAIEFEETVELPGLDESQQQLVRQKYAVAMLNYRWKTFSNIEDDPQRLFNMRRYATRYNRMLWKLLTTEKRKNTFRYRY